MSYIQFLIAHLLQNIAIVSNKIASQEEFSSLFPSYNIRELLILLLMSPICYIQIFDIGLLAFPLYSSLKAQSIYLLGAILILCYRLQPISGFFLAISVSYIQFLIAHLLQNIAIVSNIVVSQKEFSGLFPSYNIRELLILFLMLSISYI